jgi:hypothetical protein
MSGATGLPSQPITTVDWISPGSQVLYDGVTIAFPLCRSCRSSSELEKGLLRLARKGKLVACRWFCGLSIEDKVPDHLAFSRARH